VGVDGSGARKYDDGNGRMQRSSMRKSHAVFASMARPQNALRGASRLRPSAPKPWSAKGSYWLLREQRRPPPSAAHGGAQVRAQPAPVVKKARALATPLESPSTASGARTLTRTVSAWRCEALKAIRPGKSPARSYLVVRPRLTKRSAGTCTV